MTAQEAYPPGGAEPPWDDELLGSTLDGAADLRVLPRQRCGQRRVRALGYLTAPLPGLLRGVQRLRGAAAASGYEVGLVYRDDPADGLRPGRGALLAALRGGRPHVLVVCDLRHLDRPGWGDGWAVARALSTELGVRVVELSRS